MLLICVISAYKLLQVSGELLSAESIARAQMATKGYYGTALNQNTFQYKLALLREIHPQVIALGSSRVMQMRAQFFLDKFANMGGAVNSAYELAQIVPYLNEAERPRLIILGVDFWWFNPRVPSDTSFPEHFIKGDELTQAKLFSLAGMLTSGKVPLNYLFSNGQRDARMMGLQAQILQDGFGPDGSYHYTSLLEGAKPSQDQKFARVRRMIRRGESIFAQNKGIDEKAIKAFLKSISQLREAGIEVVTFVPPLSQSAIDELIVRDGDLPFRTELNRRLMTASTRHFDFTEGRLFGSGDCEFIDGFHGGEVTYARILMGIQKLGFQNLNLALDELERVVEAGKGFAANPDQRLGASREVDFLDIGCKKETPQMS